ncbi:hypothetical protein EVAR_19628_1 [Eumeta japonica]|uniref:Uncharacterized protein n=1 Tax=Eumeta variegata TaxID=151549 RepID=A0A4C1UGQ9_EUMVA|nr:hypothetical protein EVAR_19628_1 [Eumeta japonica]
MRPALGQEEPACRCRVYERKGSQTDWRRDALRYEAKNNANLKFKNMSNNVTRVPCSRVYRGSCRRPRSGRVRPPCRESASAQCSTTVTAVPRLTNGGTRYRHANGRTQRSIVLCKLEYFPASSMNLQKERVLVDAIEARCELRIAEMWPGELICNQF